MSWRLKDKLIGHWPLNGHARDVSGYNNHGIWVPSSGEKYIDGPFGNSIADFDNASKIDCGQGKGRFNFGTGAFAVSVNFKSDDSGVVDALVTKINIGSYGWYLYIRNDNKLGGVLTDQTPTSDILASTTLVNDRANHHAIFTVDENECFLYLDGKLESYQTRDAGNINNTQPLAFGANGDGSNDYDGGLWDIKLFNILLTYDEAIKLWESSHK